MLRDELQGLVDELAHDACVALFEAYGVEIVDLPAHEYVEVQDELSLTGVVGFTGPGVSGMCLLACTDGPLVASNPAGGAARDWMAELANQLAGRLKHKLIARGAVVYITTPIVLRGARLEPAPRHELRVHRFVCQGGRMSLWVEVESEPGFKLSHDSLEETMAEGETLLF